MATKTEDNYTALLREQLITKEDPKHVHKALALLCIASYVFRLSHFPNMAFDTHPNLTLPTCFLHFLLNASAFLFKIPQRRIKDGSRIWPEYRLHSFIFVTRSLLAIALYWFEKQYNIEPMYWLNTVVQLIFIGLADLASWSVGSSYQSETVRDLYAPGYFKFASALVQLRAGAGVIYGRRRSGYLFYTVFVIQNVAFLGTMNRKNLTNKVYIAIYYGMMLVVGTTLSFIDLSDPWIHLSIHAGLSNTIAIFRMGPRLPKPFHLLHSKYVLYGLGGIAAAYVRPNADGTLQEGGPTEAQIRAYAFASTLGLVALAIWKIPQYPPIDMSYYIKVKKLE